MICKAAAAASGAVPHNAGLTVLRHRFRACSPSGESSTYAKPRQPPAAPVTQPSLRGRSSQLTTLPKGLKRPASSSAVTSESSPPT